MSDKKSDKKSEKKLKGSSRHEATHAAPTGLGAEAAKSQRRAKENRLWDLDAEVPKWCPRPIGITKSLDDASDAAALELESAKALRALRRKLEELVKPYLSNVRPLTLERWRWAAKWEEEQAGSKKAILHPSMPSRPAPAADGELLKELQRQGLGTDSARQVVAELRKTSEELAGRLLKQRHAVVSGGKAPPAPPLKLTFNRHNIDFAAGKAQIKVSHSVYGKLAILHRRHAPAAEATAAPSPVMADGSSDADVDVEAAEAEAAKAEADAGTDGRLGLHQRIFAMVLRYRSLQGDGFQAAIGKPVWECLQSKLGVACECFASPLNGFLPSYGSGFADVDGPFGSRGSFFGFKNLLAGSFAANPPFVHPIMDAMAQHILSMLQAAADAQGDHALSFTVIIPGWAESECYQKLKASPFMRRHVLIAAADHGYCDGASYQRQDPYRHSPFDTAVLVMQTDKAARKWAANDGFEAGLRTAFAACVPSEAAVARQLKRDAGARGAVEGQGQKKKRKRDGGDGGPKGDGAERPKYDPETEKKLNEWVQAKRKGAFDRADEIRSELSAQGVDCAAARPPRQKLEADKVKRAKREDAAEE